MPSQKEERLYRPSNSVTFLLLWRLVLIPLMQRTQFLPTIVTVRTGARQRHVTLELFFCYLNRVT